MRLLSAIVSLTVLLGMPVANANDFADRTALQRSAASLFIAEKFDALDAMADAFRTSRERTSSGIWKLTVFYYGIDPTVLNQSPDEDSYRRFENLALDWSKARPDSIAAQLTYAQLLYEHAWLSRGGGYWTDLTDEQRDGYLKYHKKFRDYLVQIKDKASIDPHWYALMALAATEEAWSDDAFDSLLSEAMGREPYYYQTYFNVFTHYQPQWGGDPSKLKDQILKISEHTKPQDGNSFIARAYWVVSGFGEDVMGRTGLGWPDVIPGFQDLVSRYPDQWNLNAYAKFACLAEDRSNFAIAYSQIKIRPIEEAWNYPNQSLVCAVWAFHPERHIQVK